MTLPLFSGRLDTIESQVVQIFQELLLKIDIKTMGSNNATQNANIDRINTITDNHETRVDSLEGLYSAISFTVNDNFATFTGHSGKVTGDGVHGHTV